MQGILSLVETLVRDLRYAVRTLRRDAALTTFAILIIGVGVGASTTVFSVVNALWLRPLPFDDPERLVWVANGPSENLSRQAVQVGHVVDLREQSQSLAGLAGFSPFYGVGDIRLTGTGEPERVTGVPVTEGFFPLLGVRPWLGRDFTAEECLWGAPRTAILSYAFWQRRLGAKADVIGGSITLDGAPVTIVGVLPPSFDFGGTFSPGRPADLFLPFPLSPETNRRGNTLAVIGRLKPGIDLTTAAAETATAVDRISRTAPDVEPGRRRNRVPSEPQSAAGSHQRPVSRHACGAGGRGRVPDAAGLGEHLEPAAGAGVGAAEGNGAADGARRRTRACGPSAARRKPGALLQRRGVGTGAGVRRHEPDRASRRRQHSTPPGRPCGRTGDGVHRVRGDAHRGRLRRAAGASSVGIRAAGRAEGRRSRRDRRRRLDAPRDRRHRNRAGLRPPDRRRLAHAESQPRPRRRSGIHIRERDFAARGSVTPRASDARDAERLFRYGPSTRSLGARRRSRRPDRRAAARRQLRVAGMDRLGQGSRDRSWRAREPARSHDRRPLFLRDAHRHESRPRLHLRRSPVVRTGRRRQRGVGARVVAG